MSRRTPPTTNRRCGREPPRPPHPPPPPLSNSSGAVRKRRQRARRAAGIEVAEIEVNVDKAISALKARDGLTEVEAKSLQWPQIEREVQTVWDEFLQVWGK